MNVIIDYLFWLRLGKISSSAVSGIYPAFKAAGRFFRAPAFVCCPYNNQGGNTLMMLVQLSRRNCTYDVKYNYQGRIALLLLSHKEHN